MHSDAETCRALNRHVPCAIRSRDCACVGLATLALVANVYAFEVPGDGGGGGGGGGTSIANCLANTTVNTEAMPAAIDPARESTLSWSIRPPAGCHRFDRVIVDGQTYGLTGSTVVRPRATTDYYLTLIVPGGYRPLGPITVTVNLAQTVNINGSTADWRKMLIQALGEGNKKIVLARLRPSERRLCACGPRVRHLGTRLSGA
jgi:hypothetical protein